MMSDNDIYEVEFEDVVNDIRSSKRYLGLSKEDLREMIKNRYGKHRLLLLNDKDILDFRDFLKNLVLLDDPKHIIQQFTRQSQPESKPESTIFTKSISKSRRRRR